MDTELSKDYKKLLADWLVENHIPSISPQVNLFLLHISEEIDKATDGTIQIPVRVMKALYEYSKSLTFLLDVSAEHQKAVINKLGDLINKGKNE